MNKRFNQISEIENENIKEKFHDFNQLNKIIENNNTTRKEIEQAYSEVFIGEISIDSYSELHFQIKFLLEESKVACNNILEFYDYKVIAELSNYIKTSIELINSIKELRKEHRKILNTFLNSRNKSAKIGLIVFDKGLNQLPTETILDKEKNNDKEIYHHIYKWYKSIYNDTGHGFVGIKEFL